MVPSITARLGKQPGLILSQGELLDGAVYLTLCGWTRNEGTFGCGGVLGTVVSPGAVVAEPGAWELALEPGWVEHDGVWRLSAHAERRVRRATREASSPSARPERRQAARDRLSRNAVAAYRRRHADPVSGAVLGVYPGLEPARIMRTRTAPLPCLAGCPRCGRVNRLDGDLVRQAVDRYAGERRAWANRHGN